MCIVDSAVAEVAVGAFTAFSFILGEAQLPIYGLARNVSVTTSNLIIPAFGSENSDGRYSDPSSNSISVAHMQIWLGTTLPAGGNLSFYFKNLTSGTAFNFTGTLNAGSSSAEVNATGVTAASGDQIAVIFSLSSGSQTLPSLQWRLS